MIEQALATWQARLRDIEHQTQPISAVADKLREAIRRVQGARLAMRRRVRGAHTRQTVLAALGQDAKTARQVSHETGVPIGTVSGTLRVLTSDGQTVKATKGYRAKQSCGDRQRDPAGGVAPGQPSS